MIPQSNPRANYLAHQAAIDAAVTAVLVSGRYILGREVAAFEEEFATAIGVDWSVGVANGTDAVELALRAVGVRTGDAVAAVSHTAVATAAAIVRSGAYPLFVDIDPQRYTMDPSALEELLASPAGRPVRAVVVVHLYGQPADMPALLALANARGIPVVEDCAQAHGATLQERTVGSWGELGCFSFYPTKNLGALGDGGAVVGRDPTLKERLRLLREYGWRQRYVSESVGVNSRLDELQAAILRIKLPYLAAENARRRTIAQHYNALLAEVPLALPQIFPGSESVFHQYVIQSDQRDRLRERLRAAGIETLIHYSLAIHQQPAFADPALRPFPLVHTESVVKRILSLPMFPELSDSEVKQVGEQIRRQSADKMPLESSQR